MTADAPGRALVLGAGGALGAAWMVGALDALAEFESFDPRALDLVVGTSAGSVTAALIGCGRSVGDMAGLLDAPGPPHVAGTGPVNAFDVHRALAAIPHAVPLPGNLRLAARSLGRPGRHTMMTLAAGLAPRGRGDLAPLAQLIDNADRGNGWPRRPAVWIVAMDFDAGRRVVFGRDGAPPSTLAQAVTASCAAPGFFPPVIVGDRRYVDGGAVSVTNADVLVRSELDEVLVLAPMATFSRPPRWSARAHAAWQLRRRFTRRLMTESARLAAAGKTVRVIAPTERDLAVIGVNMMNPGRRREVLETAMVTTREQLRASTPAADAEREVG
jgi:NTE family protein